MGTSGAESSKVVATIKVRENYLRNLDARKYRLHNRQA